MKSSADYSVSVIVPVYNEIGLITHSLNYINGFLHEHFADYEILIIESGSTDGTAEECDNIARENGRIKIIHEGSRKGFGSAVKTGLKCASKDLVWMITVDVPFPLEAIFYALPLLGKYDCILSFRLNDNRGLFRRIQSFAYNYIIRIIFNVNTRHINSAFKLYKNSIAKRLQLLSNGWIIDAEIIVRLNNLGVACAEIPVPLIERRSGRTSITASSYYNLLREIISLKQRMKVN